MSVEIYDTIAGEKFERVIARHERVQNRLAAETRPMKMRVQQELARSKSRTHPDDIEEAMERRRSFVRIEVPYRGIDHHVVLVGPVAASLNKRALQIIKRGVGKSRIRR